jgi:hypothetical protein
MGASFHLPLLTGAKVSQPGVLPSGCNDPTATVGIHIQPSLEEFKVQSPAARMEWANDPICTAIAFVECDGGPPDQLERALSASGPHRPRPSRARECRPIADRSQGPVQIIRGALSGKGGVTSNAFSMSTVSRSCCSASSSDRLPHRA